MVVIELRYTGILYLKRGRTTLLNIKSEKNLCTLNFFLYHKNILSIFLIHYGYTKKFAIELKADSVELTKLGHS